MKRVVSVRTMVKLSMMVTVMVAMLAMNSLGVAASEDEFLDYPEMTEASETEFEEKETEAPTEAPTEATTKKKKTVYYNFELKIEGQGQVPGYGTSYSFPKGTHVNMDALADEGWVFNGWEGDYDSSSTSAVVIMDGDKSVTAVFVKVPVETEAPSTAAEETTTEAEILDETIALSDGADIKDQALPQTGGLSALAILGLGGLVTAAGFSIKKK